MLVSRILRILGLCQLGFYVMKSPTSHDAELIEYRFWDLQAFYLKVFAPPLKRSWHRHWEYIHAIVFLYPSNFTAVQVLNIAATWMKYNTVAFADHA